MARSPGSLVRNVLFQPPDDLRRVLLADGQEVVQQDRRQELAKPDELEKENGHGTKFLKPHFPIHRTFIFVCLTDGAARICS